ncbi:MAG: sugar phosphate nucleotidyltransferase [Planctomycetota bacterium]
MSAPLVGAILAAGRGDRIKPLSDELPKPLLPLLEHPIIGWQILALRELGITDVYVVVGYLGDRLRAALGDGDRFGVRLHYVEQTTRDGLAPAVGQLEPHVAGRSFVLFLGDIYIDLLDLAPLVELRAEHEPSADVVLAVSREPDPAVLRRNFEVLLDAEGRVRAVREKPAVVEGDLKGSGLYRFSPEIFESIRRTPRSELRGEFELTDAIQVHIDRGFVVRPAAIAGRDWNISAPHDLLALNLEMLDQRQEDRFVAGRVAPGAVLVRSVVLAGAEVATGAHLENCVALPGARVPAGTWSDTLFHRGGALVPVGDL